MMVDLDAQCNLTQICVRRDVEVNFNGNFDAFFAQFGPGLVLDTVLAGLNKGLPGQPTTLESPRLLRVQHPELAAGRLFLLRGDPQLEEFEKRVSDACTLIAIAGQAQVPGLLYNLMWRTASAYDIQVVLLDLSPALGVFNKLAICSSDYVIAPCAPDYFSLKAIEMLTMRFGNWVRYFDGDPETPNVRHVSQGSTYLMNTGVPKFFGIILSRFIYQADAAPNANTRRFMVQIQEASIVHACPRGGDCLFGQCHQRRRWHSSCPRRLRSLECRSA
eukprot:m.63336 g.63336  ORF g.63336 m.63336 type:complete len:275 (-) comp7189_c0_seq1:1527-2351(-)